MLALTLACSPPSGDSGEPSETSADVATATHDAPTEPSDTEAAIEMLGEVQRYELASFGVDVAIVEPGLFATEIFDNAAWADDEARNAEYGDLAHKGRQGVAIAKQMMTTQQFDPQRVADAVLRLARLPAGQRPLRTPVGEDSAAMLEPIDALTSPFTQGMFKAFGFM